MNVLDESAITNQDSERIRLKPPGTGGPKYTQQLNETNELQVSAFSQYTESIFIN